MADFAFATIGFIGQCYSGAIEAYRTFERCMSFHDTSAKLLLKLEVERIRLQLWGKNSGVAEGSLSTNLLPFESTLIDILTRTTRLFQDSERLKTYYGLMECSDGKPDSAITGPSEDLKTAFRIKDAFNLAFEKTSKRKPNLQTSKPLPPPPPSISQSQPKPYARLRWAIASQERFETLIVDLRGFVDSLNQLLRESQLASFSQEWRLVELQTVSALEDGAALRILGAATAGDYNLRGLFALTQRKSVAVAKLMHKPAFRNLKAGQSSSLGSPSKLLSKGDFDLPQNYNKQDRCIGCYRPLDELSTQPIYVLVEKKHYDSDASSEDIIKLLFRVQKLIELFNVPDGDTRALLKCLGYWSEPVLTCWCLVFRLPPSLVSSNTSPRVKLSLSISLPTLQEFLSIETFRPPLETRLQLASTLATTLASLYGSKWLHKGIRSQNILFPFSIGGSLDLSNPYVVGFEYSRQYTEQSTIDKTPFNTSQAIYRHPNYQGLAAKGYKLQYDIYSFGLILVEIAWWMPLRRFLQVHTKHSARKASPANGESLLSNKEDQTPFGPQEASDFKRQLIKQVKKDLAFRVSSAYSDAVEWCLTCGDGVAEQTAGELVAEFFTNAVVPLENLARSLCA